MPGHGMPETSVNLSAAELGAWRGMLRVHTALVKALDAELAAAHDLPLSSYEVLITLESAPGRKRRMAELADSVLLSRSGMTRLVDRLESDGLLVRDTCTDDGRGCFAVLTEKGAELLATARPTHLDGVRERFLRHFSEDELRLLAALWERVLPGSAGLDGLTSWPEGRERILETAYELFSQARHARRRRGPHHRRGGRGEDDAVPQLRVQGRADRRLPRRARGALDARLAAGRGRAARERRRAARLLAIFDVFGEWFARADFEGCSFINVMLELTDREDPGRVASVQHLSVIREFLAGLATEAGVADAGGVRAPVAHPDEGLDRRRRRGRRRRPPRARRSWAGCCSPRTACTDDGPIGPCRGRASPRGSVSDAAVPDGRGARTGDVSAVRAPEPPPQAMLLRLQRSAGNAAVGRLLARDPAPAEAPPAPTGRSAGAGRDLRQPQPRTSRPRSRPSRPPRRR